MDTVVQFLAATVLATADICSEPFVGGVEEPQFCRLNSSLELSTPYFSVTVEPNFLVGVDREGRRLFIQSSIRQSQDYLQVEVHLEANAPKLTGCPEIKEWSESGVAWQECRRSSETGHERRLQASMAGRYVLIEYGYSTLGTVSAPALERMTQSIRVLAPILDSP